MAICSIPAVSTCKGTNSNSSPRATVATTESPLKFCNLSFTSISISAFWPFKANILSPCNKPAVALIEESGTDATWNGMPYSNIPGVFSIAGKYTGSIFTTIVSPFLRTLACSARLRTRSI